MGGAVFLPCYLTWGQTMVEVKWRLRRPLSKGSMRALLHSVSPILQQATADLPPCQDPWTLTGKSSQSLVGSLLLSPGPGVHKVLFVPFNSLFPQSRVSSLGSTLGLKVTSSKRAYAISRAPTPAAVHCWPVSPQETLKHSSVSVSVGSLCPGMYKVCLSPLSVSCGNGGWLYKRICPSYHLARASLLPLDVGYLLTAAPVPTSLLGFFWPLTQASSWPSWPLSLRPV